MYCFVKIKVKYFLFYTRGCVIYCYSKIRMCVSVCILYGHGCRLPFSGSKNGHVTYNVFQLFSVSFCCLVVSRLKGSLNQSDIISDSSILKKSMIIKYPYVSDSLTDYGVEPLPFAARLK